MKNILFALVLGLAVGQASGQKLAKLKKGNEFYLNKQYTEAISEYESLMTTESGKAIMGVDSRINLADCYRMTNQNVKAEQLYRELTEQAGSRPELLINYGEVLIGVGKYDEAKGQFSAYSKLRPEDSRSAELIKKCDDIQAIRPLYYDVKIEPQIAVNDSSTEQFGLSYYGKGLVFASNQILSGNVGAEWKGIAGVDMLYSEISAEGNLLAPRLLSKKLNGINRQDGPATFTRDGKTIVYSQSVKVSPNAPEGTICLQLFTAKNEGGKWSKPELLPFNIPDLIFTHPCLSADGSQLFFVSNMTNGSMGGLDIWVSSYKNGKWSTPRNAGEAVNTKADESFPFLHPAGDLYFASKGHGNYGGFDLFKASPVGNGIDWEKAVNIGAPINTAFDDSYFLLSDDQTFGYLVSDKNGSDDIYKFVLENADPKTLPDNIAPRSAAIFNDSTDLEGLIVETPVDNTKKENPADIEKYVDEQLANGGKKDNPADNKTDNPTDKNPANPDDKNNIADNGGKNPKKSGKTDKNPDDSEVINTNPVDNSNPDKNPDQPNTDVVDNGNPDQPTENPDDSKKDNSKTSKSGKSGKGGKTDKTDKNAEPAKVATELLVELQVVDAANKSPLGSSAIVLRNAFTGKEEKLKVENGVAKLALKPDQKYEVIASCDGYYGGRLPITTMGAYKNETVAATFPLVKKD